jgi:signal transduction histidine kinase
MKFLTKINRNYLLPLTVILVAIIISVYFILRIIITQEARENLFSRMYLVEQQIKNTGEIPNLYPIIEVQKATQETKISQSFRKVKIWNELEKEDEIFLEYSGKVNIDGSWFIIKLRQFTFENEDLILLLVFTLFILLSSAFTISYFSTRKMNRTVWSSFEHNLHEIENYRLKLEKDITFEKSDIEEFERLSNVVTDFTRKMRSDYFSLKEFTENASHEIQTPVSIALINLEEILQLDIKKDLFQKVVIVINSLKRLSAINQNLILLTKIENRQFEASNEVSFKEILLRKKAEFSGLFEAKEVDVDLSSEGDFKVRMNEYLSDVLISNLLSNAVNHNIKEGTIKIRIKPGVLNICNTAEDNTLTNENIFNRFVSGNSKSSGLGLAIVRQICEIHDLEVQYQKDVLHCFTIRIKL